MTLNEYTTLTGLTVASADQTRVTAELARAQRKLEQMLGYTLTPENRNTNFYNELGKTDSDYACPVVDTDTLLAPDAVVNGYRLFPYRPNDPYMAVDPYLSINKVKLVYIRTGDGSTGVTVKTFDEDYLGTFTYTTWGKYLHEYPGHWLGWACAHRHNLLLAVDADWGFETIPAELNEVLADMVTYYKDDDRDKKSESVLTHSWTKFDRSEPESLSYSMNIVAKYAGPNGTAYKELVA